MVIQVVLYIDKMRRALIEENCRDLSGEVSGL